MDDDLAAALAMSMEGTEASSSQQAAAQLAENSRARLAENGTLEVLGTLLGNLAKSPAEEKYRRLKLSNAKIGKALSSAGAEQLLLAAGFLRSGELLEVPVETPAEKLRADAEAALEALELVKGNWLLSAQLRAEGDVRCVTALANGGLAFGSMDNLIRVFGAVPAAATSAPAVLAGHQRRAGVDGVLALAELGQDLISAGRDGRIIRWRDGKEVADLKGHGENVQGTNVHVVSCLSALDGKLLSGGWDKTVRLWEEDAQKAVMSGHEIAVNAVAGLENGDVASGSGDQTIAIWRNGAKLRSLPAKQVVRALCALPGALVAAGTNDGCVRLWDASSGQLAAERQVAQSYILSLARDPDTGHLAAGTSEGQVVILEHAGSELKVLEELQLCGEVYGLSFLSSGDLACACGDGSCCVFTRAIARAAPKALREDFASRAQALAAARAPAPAVAAGAAPGYAGGFDFSFPVDFGAQKLTLSWNRHEEPKAVAERFLRENNLDPRHSGDVVAFVMQSMATSAGAGGIGGIGGAGKEFNFPVEVMDGRRLTISWNRGENPQEVALNFARQHRGISAAELPDIVSFIQQASGGPVQMQQAAPSPVIPPAMQQELLQQVMAMGFPEQSARQALESSAWDAQLAVAKLLG